MNKELVNEGSEGLIATPIGEVVSEFEALVEDFKSKCGYNQEDAEIAAKNVLLEDNKPYQY